MRSLGSNILLKIVSENQFSGKTYFYAIHPRIHGRFKHDDGAGTLWNGSENVSTCGGNVGEIGFEVASDGSWDGDENCVAVGDRFGRRGGNVPASWGPIQ